MRKSSRGRDSGARSAPKLCPHLCAATSEAAPLTPGECQDCADLDEHTWAHLRMCVTCGHVGCCDSSPHQHASEHFRATGHPVMRSVEPGEDWRWCYIDVRLG
ncbi:UBP-type zinc finger domain-containing protein [Mycobacterium sp. ITM-2016-00318]|uniref:UBP-type zinc finger domain-containing protein n=1 Tax=Mycobacterium sp. ITM-2016-00318 TaxID=2099693 RepID=UPI000CF8D8F3|nr:UBP-type zinc finger domain-containing protein [Mycobacterium sp. ITM-2016-00318]WNG93313.1 UBP-type zinc finger domain-containing protein [Mycobacterium sp. ITM-2016-00318]